MAGLLFRSVRRRLCSRSSHYSGMETPTSLLVGGGILALLTYGLILRGLNLPHKRAHNAETGHERAERRERQWYWNQDRNKKY
jgi:hypothetical protein